MNAFRATFFYTDMLSKNGARSSSIEHLPVFSDPFVQRLQTVNELINED